MHCDFFAFFDISTYLDCFSLFQFHYYHTHIEKLKAAKVGKFITFKVTDVPYLLYNGLDQTKGHYVCSNTFRGEEEYGTNWKVTNAHMCERTVS